MSADTKIVSIRTRSFDRVMLEPMLGPVDLTRFNPHPVFRPGDAKIARGWT